VPTPGGEYFLLEPFLNLEFYGLLLYLPAFVAITNWSIRAVNRFERGKGNALSFLLGGMYLILIFRTLWYGIGAIIKGLTIAFLAGAALIGATRMIGGRRSMNSRTMTGVADPIGVEGSVV
jgi:hypothetical protein